jgi:osmoprotectant transport system substrate-binding protein
MRTTMKLVTAAAVGACLLSACGLDEDAPTQEVNAGSLAEEGDLSGVKLNVGGKEFTEQLILCELTAQALESAGAEVERTCGLNGTNPTRKALTGGKIDLYWEYTGTGWITHLGETKAIDDPQQLFESVASADEEKNGITWLDPSPANNTYAVAVSSETAEELDVETMSDYADLANSDPEKASFCGAAEFFSRDDGWPGLQKAYGFELPDGDVSELAAGPIYQAIDKADPCNFGEVFATDGRIAGFDLKVLEDDKQFFAIYNPAVSIRSDVLEKSPEIADVLAPVSEALTDEALQALNAELDVEGGDEATIANDWLIEEGFISE